MTDSGDCTRLNRGMAILGDEVFLGTLNAHVIALNAKTGNVVWDVTAADYRTGYSFPVAPLTVKRCDRDRRLPQRIWRAGSSTLWEGIRSDRSWQRPVWIRVPLTKFFGFSYCFPRFTGFPRLTEQRVP